MNMESFCVRDGEKPLDSLKPDGGFCGIFRTIACVGDSLASGEFESTDAHGEKGYHDYFDYSWGQYIARAAGVHVYNFSRGGMTASEYMESWGRDNDVWNPAKAAQAYIVALGVNDILNMHQALGCVDDIIMDCPSANKKTFAGYYGQILQGYRRIQPKARLFLMTMPRESTDMSAEREILAAQHARLLYEIAERFEYTYVLDFNQYGPVYDAAFARRFFLGGHMNPSGYMLTATMTMSYIDYLIRLHPEDFAQIGFVGTPFHNTTQKW